MGLPLLGKYDYDTVNPSCAAALLEKHTNQPLKFNSEQRKHDEIVAVGWKSPI